MGNYKQTRDAAGTVTSQYGQMLRNLDDDLVRRLRESGSRSEVELHEDREEAADRIEELGVAYVQADHIEELEAMLAKAIDFVAEVGGGFKFGESLVDWANLHVLKARTLLAELKGKE